MFTWIPTQSKPRKDFGNHSARKPHLNIEKIRSQNENELSPTDSLWHYSTILYSDH